MAGSCRRALGFLLVPLLLVACAQGSSAGNGDDGDDDPDAPAPRVDAPSSPTDARQGDASMADAPPIPVDAGPPPVDATPGTLGQGEACSASAQCQAGLCCTLLLDPLFGCALNVPGLTQCLP
jgi:hypothetical protein